MEPISQLQQEIPNTVQQELEPINSGSSKTAMILLTGYLGSGKTTLIQYILKQQSELRVAIIQNEFADEMGIESPLMQDSEGKPFDKFYELPNGCICCTAKGDLLTAVEYLIKNETKPLDFILVETNGLADPSAAVKEFWVDENLDFPGELRSIHTVVPVHRYASLQTDEIFNKQLLYADHLLLNQIDKATEEEIHNVEVSIRKLNPIATITRTSFCEINLKEIFDLDGYRLRSEKEDLIQNYESDCNNDSCEAHNHSHKHNHVHASSDIQAFYFDVEKDFDFKQLELTLGELVWEHPTIQVLRMKGLISITNDPYKYALQGVEDIFEIKKSEVQWPKSVTEDNQQQQQQHKRKSKFLFVCKHATREELANAIGIEF